MDLFTENTIPSRVNGGFPRPPKVNRQGALRRPLGEITTNVYTTRPLNPVKAPFSIYQDPENRDIQPQNDLRTVKSSFPPMPQRAAPLAPMVPFVIHQDDTEDEMSSELSSTFPPPPSIPSAAELSMILPPGNVNDFRQNISISSVSTDDCEDDYYEEDTATESDVQSSKKGEKLYESLEDEELLMIDDRAGIPESVLAVNDYAYEVFTHARQREIEYAAKTNYMEKQTDISFPMRSILIDWMIEVSEEFELRSETTFLAINYVDRFLSYMSVQRAKLQLVGTSSLFIASKYEEIYPHDLTKFVYITDDTYNGKQVLKMEKLILGVLKFSVSPPTAYYFVTHVAKMACCNDKTTSLAQYLTELTLLDGETYLNYLPSMIGAASVALARHTLGFAAWDDAMVAKTGYNVGDFQACLINIHGSFVRAKRCPQKSIVEKYQSAKHHCVANVEPTPIF